VGAATSPQRTVGSGNVGVGDMGLAAEAEAGRGSEFFERIDCAISCSFVISRAICPPGARSHLPLVGSELVYAAHYLLLSCGHPV
jgi:hypothetical protein